MKRRPDISDPRPGFLEIVQGGPVTEPPPTSSTQRTLRRAPIEVLQRGLRVYNWVGHFGFIGTPTCLLLGVWLDWRWFPTALLPLALWGLAHGVCDLIESELERRKLVDDLEGALGSDTPEGG